MDQAIELLISEDTEAFVLTALKSDNEGMHLVQAHQEESDMVLLTIFTLIEEIRKKSVEAGTPLSPEEIMYSAGAIAEEHGYLDGEFADRGSGE